MSCQRPTFKLVGVRLKVRHMEGSQALVFERNAPLFLQRLPITKFGDCSTNGEVLVATTSLVMDTGLVHLCPKHQDGVPLIPVKPGGQFLQGGEPQTAPHASWPEAGRLAKYAVALRVRARSIDPGGPPAARHLHGGASLESPRPALQDRYRRRA